MLTYLKDYFTLEQACCTLKKRLKWDYVLEVADLRRSLSEHNIKTYSEFNGAYRFEKVLSSDLDSIDGIIECLGKKEGRTLQDNIETAKSNWLSQDPFMQRFEGDSLDEYKGSNRYKNAMEEIETNFLSKAVKHILEKEKEALKKILISPFNNEMVEITLENIGINYEHEFIYLDLKINGLLAGVDLWIEKSKINLPNDNNHIYCMIDQSTLQTIDLPDDLILNSDVDKLFKLLYGDEEVTDEQETQFIKYRKEVLDVLKYVAASDVDGNKIHRPSSVFERCSTLSDLKGEGLPFKVRSFSNRLKCLGVRDDDLRELVSMPQEERKSFLDQFPKTS